MEDRKGTVKMIMELPEGKQFLAALLFAIMFLAATMIIMAIGYSKAMKECEQDKAAQIKEINQTFLNFVIEENRKKELTKEKIDSMNLELIKLKLWKKDQ